MPYGINKTTYYDNGQMKNACFPFVTKNVNSTSFRDSCRYWNEEGIETFEKATGP